MVSHTDTDTSNQIAAIRQSMISTNVVVKRKQKSSWVDCDTNDLCWSKSSRIWIYRRYGGKKTFRLELLYRGVINIHLCPILYMWLRKTCFFIHSKCEEIEIYSKIRVRFFWFLRSWVYFTWITWSKVVNFFHNFSDRNFVCEQF